MSLYDVRLSSTSVESVSLPALELVGLSCLKKPDVMHFPFLWSILSNQSNGGWGVAGVKLLFP